MLHYTFTTLCHVIQLRTDSRTGIDNSLYDPWHQVRILEILIGTIFELIIFIVKYRNMMIWFFIILKYDNFKLYKTMRN